MALFQTGWSTRQLNTATADCAGEEVAQEFEHTFTAVALAAGDIVELGILPAYNKISDAILAADAVGAGITFDIGIMSGEVGDPDAARTCDASIFAASNVAAAGGVARVTLATAFTIASKEFDRSVGLKIVAPGAQAAGTKVRLILKYRA